MRRLGTYAELSLVGRQQGGQGHEVGFRGGDTQRRAILQP